MSFLLLLLLLLALLVSGNVIEEIENIMNTIGKLPVSKRSFALDKFQEEIQKPLHVITDSYRALLAYVDYRPEMLNKIIDMEEDLDKSFTKYKKWLREEL